MLVYIFFTFLLRNLSAYFSKCVSHSSHSLSHSLSVFDIYQGSDVIIVDDMIDTAGTLCEAANQLRIHGAKRVFAFASHGLFSGPALKRIEESVLEEVVVADTIQLASVG